jgi:hypothetical protein
MAISNVAMIAYSVYSAITAKKQSFNTSGYSIDEDSAANAWDGVHTTSAAGGPIPLIYGTRVSGGNIINEFATTDGEKNYLHTQMVVSQGEVDSITLRRINRNLAANYSGYTFYSRLGTLDQEVTPNFDDVHSVESIGVELIKDTPYTHTTVKTDVEAFSVRLQLPSGLWQQDDNGNLASYSVTYKVEYKLHTDSTYTSLGEQTFSAKSRSKLYTIFRKDGLTAGQYDIRVTKTAGETDEDGYYTADLYLHEIDEINTDAMIHPGLALAAVSALAYDQLSGAAPDYEMLVRGIKVLVPQVMNGATEVGWDDYYWDPTADCYRLLSDGTVLTWDGATYVRRYSANPIWCIYDFITNKDYGLGNYIDTSDMDLSYLLEQAKYCDEKVPDGEGGYEKRFRLDVVIDSLQDALDLILSLCSVCRGVPFLSDKDGIKIVIKKPSSPVQLFHMGNIVKDSFSETWKSLRDVHNRIDVQYDDEDNNYEADTITYEDDTALNAGDPPKTVSTRYLGKKLSYALRHGRDYLYNEKYHTRTSKLRTGFCGMLRQVGEVVDVAHDVPQWGFSGLLQPGSTTTKIKLDRAVTIESGKSYAVRVDFYDGTYVERNVTDAAGTYTELTLDEALPKTPGSNDRYDGYSFGELEKVAAPHWITKVTRLRSGEVEFELEEYVEEIFDDTAVEIPDRNYSSLSTDFPNVTDLTLDENTITLSDGTVQTSITVSFTKPDLTSYTVGVFNRVKIYYSDNDGLSWIYAGETSGEEFTISEGIKVGSTYVICVVAVSATGEERVITASPQEDITVVGKILPPADIKKFYYSWGDVLSLQWSSNTETDLAGYEIRDSDSGWGIYSFDLGTENGDTLITESGDVLIIEPYDSGMVYKGLATKKVLYPTSREVGTYYIRAFNTSGLYSENAVSVTPELLVPSTPEGLGADIMFNTARVYWTDNRPTNLLYYEVWRSETNLWSGEEQLVGRVSGKSIMMNSRSPRSGTAQSGSNTMLVDNSLIGFGDGYFLGDTIVITKGTGEGLSAKITGFDDETGELTFADIGAALDSTSQYNITDNTWIKVRGVDQYGAGVSSSALEISYENLTEEMFGDNVITARKIYVACLSALSANLGCVTAGVIQGATIQTASGGARTVFSGTELRTYDADNNVMFEVKDGCVVAKTMQLVDPICCCCYSYLSSGQWYFHNEAGDVTPYVKRIESGEACTGCKVVLERWRGQPSVQVGIKELDSYNSVYSANCQRWCVYYDNLCCYNNGGVDYGWCFNVHAILYKSSGEYGEEIHDVAPDISVYTHGDASCTTVRTQFNFWCFCSTCSNCFGYGTHCYIIKYKCCEAGCAWTCCSYTYIQSHSTTTELTTCAYKCHSIAFPSAGCWEIQLSSVSTSWTITSLLAISYCCCCRTLASFTSASYVCSTCWDQNCVSSCNAGNVFSGANPTNVYCAYLCYSSHVNLCIKRFDIGCACNGSFHYVCECLSLDGSALINCGVCVHCIPYSCLSPRDFFVNGVHYYYACQVPNRVYIEPYNWICYDITCTACLGLSAAAPYYCINGMTSVCIHGSYSQDIATWATICFGSSYLIQCYCSAPSNCTSCYAHLFSTKDYSAEQQIIDPNGVLNYIAISYN